MDNKKQTGAPDSKTINLNEDYEVKYWTEKFAISKQELEKAVSQVGKSVAAVTKYLQK